MDMSLTLPCLVYFFYSTNNFYTIVDLEEGEHLYKYYVDGQWVINPDEVVYLTIVVSP